MATSKSASTGRGWALLLLLCLAPGCGSKTGLDSPLPPPCELPPIEPPASCARVERGDVVLLEGPRPRHSLRLDVLARGPVVHAGAELDGADVITVHPIDLEGRPTSPATELPRPVARGRVTTVALVDGCLPVFSIHAVTGDAPFAPGPCAFYVSDSVGFRFLPGVWDRCIVTQSSVQGLRFDVTRDGRRELRRAGIDGAFLDREPLETGPEAPFLELRTGDGRSSGFFFESGFGRRGFVVSPDGTSTSVDLGGTPLSIGVFRRTMYWVRAGVLFLMSIDDRGDPILPFEERRELGTDLISVAIRAAGDVVWLMVWSEGGVSLTRVDEELELVGPTFDTGLVAPAQFLPTSRGLLMVGATPDMSLVAVPWNCAD